MKLKNTLFLSTFLSTLLPLIAFSTQAAQELSPEKAQAIQPFKRITVTGRFNSIYDAADMVSRRADSLGADAFYIQDLGDANSNGGNWRVTADLYHKDAPASEKVAYRKIEGVTELPKEQAFLLEPYDTVTLSGYFSSQPDVLQSIAKAAKNKGASAFYIVRQIDANNGGNQFITAFIYKADAPKRKVQNPDAIPRDSDAGKAALAAGGKEAAKVEIPGVASSASPSTSVGRFFETQSSTGKRYTVTLSDGTQVQELNNATAAQMTPFDTVTFTGHFNSMTDVSAEVAKRAAAKNAKFYHITRQWESKNGGNLTVTADLFK